MSRSYKRYINYVQGPKALYKNWRVRWERAAQRQALMEMTKTEKSDLEDIDDDCGDENCEYCCIHYGIDAGPTHQLVRFNWWEFD